MDELLKKPWVIRLVSLALAILLFTAVSLDESSSERTDPPFFGGSEETQTIDNVPVDIVIDQEKFAVSGVPETVSVDLQGSAGVVTSTATQMNFDLFVNLEGLESGTHMVPIESSGIPDSLQVYIEPEEIEVTIEERATQEFEVTVGYTNENDIATGFELGEATVQPSTVTITSAKSVVDTIASVNAFVDVSNADEPIENREVPVKVYDSQGNELSVRIEPSTVNVSVDINDPNKTVPIQVETTGEAQEDITINTITTEPEVVQVFASDSVLQDLESVATEAIDLSEITEDTTLEVELIAPADSRKMNIQTITVTIEVDKTVEQTFEDVPIEVDNLVNDLTVTFISPEESQMDVIATGLEDVMAQLTNNDFQLSIDLDGLEEGEHQIPVDIDGPDNIEVQLELETVTVQIDQS
ncbi:CdaR family protein [Aquibacillus rhizosphaerae]|uniref:CdaR family protein n=1 Tax=Aquibacillus rhizosphaerae TaxID=3051431 RepID=A0ABT7L7P3_9BACI|nr:CdaR family protein [Aquibacillus sp. LR5S19]MDL4841252.1 CdaR family protein [Aquibacillus sp. LR5S19]